MSMKCPFPMLSLTLFPHCIPCLPSSGSCKVMKGKGHMFLIEPIIHYSVNLGGNGSCMFHHEWVLSQVLKAKKTGGGPPFTDVTWPVRSAQTQRLSYPHGMRLAALLSYLP